jgi:predicted 3-demethylubiquinone-9 3-methyltransferase (glyoxalase superfamily)
MPNIKPFLWFDTQAEEAARFYTTVFPNSTVTDVQRFGPEGSVTIVEFELDGKQFSALNGGPQHFTFNESISFEVDCADQAEVDAYWEKLGADGGQPGPCGWLKDKYGVSWQIVPTALPDLLTDPDPDKAGRVQEALMKMSKIDIKALQEAHRG